MKPAPVLTAFALAVLQACAHGGADAWPTRRWTPTTATKIGLDGGSLAALDAEIASGALGHVDSVLVVRRGRIAYEPRGGTPTTGAASCTRCSRSRRPSCRSRSAWPSRAGTSPTSTPPS